jgi:hypothetical protein
MPWPMTSVWTISGLGPCSRTWSGKRQVRQGLMVPLFAQFADTYRNWATRIVAKGDMVVVECRGAMAGSELRICGVRHILVASSSARS